MYTQRNGIYYIYRSMSALGGKYTPGGVWTHRIHVNPQPVWIHSGYTARYTAGGFVISLATWPYSVVLKPNMLAARGGRGKRPERRGRPDGEPPTVRRRPEPPPPAPAPPNRRRRLRLRGEHTGAQHDTTAGLELSEAAVLRLMA